MANTEKGPVQTSIETKLTKELNPTSLEIINESSKHAHHEPMKGVTSKETHFNVNIVSDEFKGKTLMQRHRLVYKILNEELEQGLHALTIKAKTIEEDKRQ